MSLAWVLMAAVAAHGYDAFSESRRAPVAVAALPAPVRATLVERARGRKVAHVEQVSFADGHISYQAEIRRHVRDHVEVEISPQGALLGEWIKPARRGSGP